MGTYRVRQLQAIGGGEVGTCECISVHDIVCARVQCEGSAHDEVCWDKRLSRALLGLMPLDQHALHSEEDVTSAASGDSTKPPADATRHSVTFAEAVQYEGSPNLQEAAVVLLGLADVDGVVLQVEVHHDAPQPLLRLPRAVRHPLPVVAKPP
jgi:hypothetical protein